jgi:hypothetical protein
MYWKVICTTHMYWKVICTTHMLPRILCQSCVVFLCFVIFVLCLVCTMLPVSLSLGCPFLIVSSVFFSNGYLLNIGIYHTWATDMYIDAIIHEPNVTINRGRCAYVLRHNIVHTRHRTKITKHKNTTQLRKCKKMSNRDTTILIAYLVRTTLFCNNCHQMHSLSTDWKSKLMKSCFWEQGV